ncbi:hypothetical protein BX616_000733 [Lobosporangium transversale]|uniref:F-box domain-containing protein n=1 Tax=Lobosporangium transversale TaxID=64571 RepID=A0A1Y2H126_9FUNG|nr:hypothetical protein BCR41DRAFT_119824 [Lobosporangium transversale]KAF9917522.1 hypothetical protein BX616_000733 [Lobosporangium transversale]ORZ27744.1 hypothetical protein BCR41DRAFT_119824 [Lobosporangium transversale]|eukprot:XP_021885447.1 hypothetical protein BCR41DRAFT_119824 [Lobosporangium transversale]
MVQLGRNRSLPAPTSYGAPLRKVKTNVFSFPTLNLTRTSSERSFATINEKGSTSRSSSKSRYSGSHAQVPLAPIITAIQKGNFVMLSEMDLDVLVKDMTGKDSKVLEALNITSSSVSISDAKILAKLIKSSDALNIKSLKMEGNMISQQASKLMFEAWKFNKTISTLSLARSGVNDKTIKYLARVIVKNESLKTLDLSGNLITSEGAEILAEAMIHNRGVTRLCLQSNKIKKAGAPFIAKILSKNRVIRHMNIGSNGLGVEGIIHIAEAVRFNRTLYSLSLDMNEMGPKGASAIATALISNRHLTHLYIPHNNIGDKGLADICESLKKNQYLISLDLELNNIGQGQSAVGLKALADVLKINTTLRELNLSYNLFSSDAVKELTAGMAMNSTLESVVFTNCCLSTDAAIYLSKVLSTPTGLQNLGLINNPDIGVDGYWALASHLIKNRSLKGIQLDYNSEDRQALYETFQNSLTRNHIWQQAIYAAACRILVLSRIVLLGRPANQKQLHLQQQHHIQQHNNQHYHGWNIFRRVKLGRSNSSNSLASLLSIGKSGASHLGNGNHVAPQSNGADGDGAEGEVGSNMSHDNSTSRQSSSSRHLHRGSISSFSTIADHHHHPHHHQQNKQSHILSNSTVTTPVEPTAIEYNPHRILANLVNMPHEIFENICAFMDPGRTMSIAQVRATVQAAGDRKTLARYYTREKMLERIFNSRYISPNGTRYGLKPGDERI